VFAKNFRCTPVQQKISSLSHMNNRNSVMQDTAMRHTTRNVDSVRKSSIDIYNLCSVRWNSHEMTKTEFCDEITSFIILLLHIDLFNTSFILFFLSSRACSRGAHKTS